MVQISKFCTSNSNFRLHLKIKETVVSKPVISNLDDFPSWLHQPAEPCNVSIILLVGV